MALNSAATLVVGTGNYLTAPEGTAFPLDVLNPEADWEKVGHTSLDEIMSITSEGGEQTVLGTLQAKSLRTTYSPRTESLAFTLQQFDTPSLKLYYGANAEITVDGLVGVPTDPVPTRCAFLAVFVDGQNYFAFYAPSADIFRGDDMAIEDTESLAGLPLQVTPLVYQDNEWAYAVTPLGESGS